MIFWLSNIYIIFKLIFYMKINLFLAPRFLIMEATQRLCVASQT